MQPLSRRVMQHRVPSVTRRWRRRRRWCQHVSHGSHSHLGGWIRWSQMMQGVMMVVMRHWRCRWQRKIQQIVVRRMGAEVQAKAIGRIESLVAIGALEGGMIQGVQTHRIGINGLVIIVVHYVMIRTRLQRMKF